MAQNVSQDMAACTHLIGLFFNSVLLLRGSCESPTPKCLWVEIRCCANAEVKTMACVGVDKQFGWVALNLCMCMCMSEAGKQISDVSIALC